MTVPTTAAFAIEGGVIAHNCMDATRYLCMELGRVMSTPPVAKMGADDSTFAIASKIGGY